MSTYYTKFKNDTPNFCPERDLLGKDSTYWERQHFDTISKYAIEVNVIVIINFEYLLHASYWVGQKVCVDFSIICHGKPKKLFDQLNIMLKTYLESLM